VQRADFIGDGWCDDVQPYNTAACGWDGGDCCSLTAANYACRDIDSVHHGTFARFAVASLSNVTASAVAATATTPGLTYPVPRNPRYSTELRPLTLQAVTNGYNNFYEFGFGKNVAGSISP